MKRLLAVILVLLFLNRGVSAMNDLSRVLQAISPNLCTTQCQYCCRNQACQAESVCTNGTTNYYAIIGGVVGGIVGLIVLRIVYGQFIKPKCCKPRAAKDSDPQSTRAARNRNSDNAEGDKKKKKGIGIKNKGNGLKKKKTINEEDIESKGEKKGDKYDPLAGNSVSTPNASVLNKPEPNLNVITKSKQDLEPLESIETKKAESKPKSRIELDEPPKEQSNSKGTKSSSNKSGDKKTSSSQKPSNKSRHNGEQSKERSKSKEKSGASNMERSKSKEKTGSNMEKSTKKKDNMTTSTKSKRAADDDAKKAAQENAENQI